MNKKVWIIFGIVTGLVLAMVFYNLSMGDESGQRSVLVGKVIFTNSDMDYNVEIKDFSFVPKEIVIEIGSTITWTNLDNVEHTATSDSDGVFDTPSLGNGESFSYTFNEVGEFPYHCTHHPSMMGKIVVGRI